MACALQVGGKRLLPCGDSVESPRNCRIDRSRVFGQSSREVSLFERHQRLKYFALARRRQLSCCLHSIPSRRIRRLVIVRLLLSQRLQVKTSESCVSTSLNGCNADWAALASTAK